MSINQREYQYYLSIVIPVYNLENNLETCLKSLYTKGKKWQVILINDGSNDKSLEVCNKYASINKNVIVINQENKGVTEARKVGAEAASGKYVLCVDGDDYLLEGALDYFINDALKYDVDIIAYGYEDENGDHMPISKPGIYEEKKLKEITKSFFYDNEKGDENCGSLFYPLWTKLIKRDLFIEFQSKQDKNLTIGEDAILSYHCLNNAKTLLISNYVGYHYKTNELSAMNKFSMTRFKKNDLFVDSVKNMNIDTIQYKYLAYHSLISTIKIMATYVNNYKEFRSLINESYSSKCWEYVKSLKIRKPRKKTYIKEIVLKKKLIFVMWCLFRKKQC